MLQVGLVDRPRIAFVWPRRIVDVNATVELCSSVVCGRKFCHRSATSWYIAFDLGFSAPDAWR